MTALEDVAAERAAQEAKWGEQNHPDGTGGPIFVPLAEAAKQVTNEAAREGNLTWAPILHEEVMEAFAESDLAKLRAELIQVAAVAVAWAEAIDRRSGAQ